MTISIVSASEHHLAGFHAAVDSVARERRYLALVEGPAVEQSAAFVRALLAGAGVQFLAVGEDGGVVGWCDIMRIPVEGFRHCGRLGMGVVAGYRGQGIGRRLAEAAIAAARTAGMERIELEVFASNSAAIRLYERLGFLREGTKHGARKLDGVLEDIVLMALRSSDG